MAELIKLFIFLPLRNSLRIFPFRPFFLILALIGYSIFGGYLFCWLERDHDLRVRETLYNQTLHAYNERLEQRKHILQQLHSLTISGASERAQLATLNFILQTYEDTIGIAEPVQPDETKTVWDIWGGMFYAGTIYTTIGFGSICAVTTYGRIATMIYALFGIPLTVNLLNELGRLLFQIMRAAWVPLGRLIVCTLPKVTPTHKLSQSLSKALSVHLTVTTHRHYDTEKGTLDETDMGAGHLPLSVAVLVLVLWICISAAIFNLIEDEWSFFESFYFFFISLTTIGLGDLVPSNSGAALVFAFVITGLSVVTVCINVVQTKLEAFFKLLLRKIEKERIKRVKKGRETVSSETGQKSEENLSIIMKDAPFFQRLLFNALPKKDINILHEKMAETLNLRTVSTQTGLRVIEIETQTLGARCGENTKLQTFENEQSSAIISSRNRPFYRPMYIYHVFD